jgi:hypothetical protein
MGIHVSMLRHATKLHNTCNHLLQNPKSRSSRTSIVYTFWSIQARLFPFSFLFQHKEMYIHTGETFKNVQNYHHLLMILQRHQFVEVHAASVSWSFMEKKCTFLLNCVWCGVTGRQLTLRNVEWQLQKSGLSQPRNVYIICPKHPIDKFYRKTDRYSVTEKKNSVAPQSLRRPLPGAYLYPTPN